MKLRTYIVFSFLLLSLSLSAQYSAAFQPMTSTSPILSERTVQQSTATGFRAISATPVINANGQAVLPAGMATATLDDSEGSTPSPFNPNVDPDKDRPNGYPIGDAVLPLLLFAFVYGLLLFFRRPTKTNKNN